VNADSDFGLISMGGYLKRANEETFIVAQIEDPEAVTIIDAVAAVEGVDVSSWV
jgi:4-hydroxy-2-oxoheptanedioate aldolase